MTERTARLPDGSGFMVVELTDLRDHPLEQQATPCVECQTKAVMFNPGLVDVCCDVCGLRENDLEIREFHLHVWVRAAVLS